MNLDLRLSLPVAAAWVAAAVIIGFPQAAAGVALALWLLAGGLLAVALFLDRRVVDYRVPARQVLASIALGCTLAALCSTAVAVRAESRQPEALSELAVQRASVIVSATTTSVVRSDADFFHATIDSIQIGDVTMMVDTPTLIFPAHGGSGWPAVEVENSAVEERESSVGGAGWGIGVSFEVAGTLASTEPGDERAVLVFASDAPVWRADPAWHLEWANQLRRTFAAATQQLPGSGGQLIGGLAIGDTAAVSEELDAAMKTSSLSHLTAVSGANCSIVVGLIMAMGGRVGAHRAVRISVSILVLIAFVVVVTPDPSVLRASLMAAAVLIALGGGRPMRGMAVLSLATIALLVFDPWLSRNFAFVLSVLATAGLLLFSKPIARLLVRWMPRWLSLVIAVPLAAQLACQPVLLMLQPSLPTYGVLANVLAAPAAPIATVVGLAACVLLPVVPFAGAALLWIAWAPSAWVAAVAEFFAAAPFARIPWWEGWFGVISLSVLTALLLAVVVAGAPWRRRMLRLLIVVMTLVGAIVAGSTVRASLTWPSDWQFAQCDVGQGDAVVVRSGGKVALVDTGAQPDLLHACLDRLELKRIDLLVLTHFDHDHVGGASAVIGRVNSVIAGPVGSASDQKLLDDLESSGAQVVAASTGIRGELGEQDWRVLWPGVRLAGLEPGNDASVVVEFTPRPGCTQQCLSALFLGDLGEAAQARLLAEGALRTVDVVKVSHHGSGDQHALLYVELEASLGLIGVGADNGYGHPTSDALNMLADSSTAVARSDTDGLVLVSPTSRSGSVRVWSERHVGGPG